MQNVFYIIKNVSLYHQKRTEKLTIKNSKDMKNSEIAAFTFGELKQNWNMYKAAIDKLFAYVRRSGQNLDYFIKMKSGMPVIKGYDMMMRRTAGDFSPKEWYNCIMY